MASSYGDVETNRSLSKNPGGGAGTCPDEIDLFDYFTVLWRRKYFIVLGAAVPSLIVCLVFFFSPSRYTVTYTYDITGDEEGLNVPLGRRAEAADTNAPVPVPRKDRLFEKKRRTILDGFYSQDNLDLLAGKLRDSGFDGFAQGLSQDKVQLEISDSLLTMTVVGRPREDVRKIASLVRDNSERVLPMHAVRQELSDNIARLKTEMALIELGKFSLELETERKRAILAKLKNMAPADTSTIAGGVILQFNDISKDGEYLPLAYQIQAAGANIIGIEETIAANQRRYDYYTDLLILNEKLLEEIKNKASSYYGITDFCSFLTGLVGEYQGDEKLVHYLNAYVKRIENAISAHAPIVERPRIYAVPKGGLKKTGIAFVALLMITTFGAFSLEAVRKRRVPAS